MCRDDSPEPVIISGDAACLIRLDDKLLILSDERTGELFIPSAQIQTGESAQCAAHRSAWEVYGFNVSVQAALGHDDNQTHYFACSLGTSLQAAESQWPLPDWTITPEARARFVDPFTLHPTLWRADQHPVTVRELFNQTPVARTVVTE